MEPLEESIPDAPRSVLIVIASVRFREVARLLEQLLVEKEPGRWVIVPHLLDPLSTIQTAFRVSRRSRVEAFHKEIRSFLADQDRVHVVAQGFGSLLLADALDEVDGPLARSRIGTVILTSSLLKCNYPWTGVAAGRVLRVVNECNWLNLWVVVQSLFNPFLGQSGRAGFDGADGIRLINRFHAPNDTASPVLFSRMERERASKVMQEWWVPLLTSDDTPITTPDLTLSLADRLLDRVLRVTPGSLGLYMVFAAAVFGSLLAKRVVLIPLYEFLVNHHLAGLLIYTILAIPASLYAWSWSAPPDGLAGSDAGNESRRDR